MPVWESPVVSSATTGIANRPFPCRLHLAHLRLDLGGRRRDPPPAIELGAARGYRCALAFATFSLSDHGVHAGSHLFGRPVPGVPEEPFESLGRLADVGDAGSTLAFSIYEAADATCGAPADAAWLDAMPIDGSVAAGASQDVQVSADASALDDGEYTAWVCVSTSDPVQAFVPVAVTLTVSGTNPDVIFEDGFDAP